MKLEQYDIVNNMTKTLIFEGIATSGKSTITNALVQKLSDHMSIALAGEEQTHMPIIDQRNELHALFFENLINELILPQSDLLILDRLYITQACRAGSSLVGYAELEDLLHHHSPHTIILTVAENAVADRIKIASEHRDPKWLDYLKTKGNTFEEIAQGYITQQRELIRLVKQSKIPYTIFDTTSHDYISIADKITKIIAD